MKAVQGIRHTAQVKPFVAPPHLPVWTLRCRSISLVPYRFSGVFIKNHLDNLPRFKRKTPRSLKPPGELSTTRQGSLSARHLLRSSGL